MTTKQLLIMALFEHLYHKDVCSDLANMLRDKAKRQVESNKSHVKAAMEAWRYEQKVKRHSNAAAVITLLISPPLFCNALDIKNGGHL